MTKTIDELWTEEEKIRESFSAATDKLQREFEADIDEMIDRHTDAIMGNLGVFFKRIFIGIFIVAMSFIGLSAAFSNGMFS